MSKKNWAIWGTAFLFTVIGTYNSVVIDSESALENSHHSLVKRLDQEGINRPARMVASQVKWEKIRPVMTVQKHTEESISSLSEASVSEDLNLILVEVINPDKFQDGLASDQFSGMLTTNEGQIETLEISLPNGLGLSLSYSQITGNVFEFEENGQTQSGMVYQVDQNAYMVSFTAGSMAGTRLRFQNSEVLMEADQVLEAQLADVGQFGQEAQEIQETEEIAGLDRQLQTFKF